MRRRFWIIVSVLVLTAIGGWLEYRHLKSQLFASAGPTTPPAAGQKGIHFGFDGVVQSDGVPKPWQSRVITGNLHIDLVEGPELSGTKALRLECQKSHFILWNSSIPYSPQEYPVLKWSWNVTVLPTNGDVREHNPIPFVGVNRSDAAVQVLVGFEGEDVLSYIWDTTAPIGTEVEEPSPVAKVRTLVVDSGPIQLNKWVPHRVNILEDYRRRFGKSPGKVIGISVQTNSNHTDSACDGAVSEIIAEHP